MYFINQGELSVKIEIEKIAELARIALKGSEKEKLTSDLQAILDYIEQLKEIDTKKVVPTSHVLDLENVFRADQIKVSEVANHVLKHAPQSQDSSFKVPKIVDK